MKNGINRIKESDIAIINNVVAIIDRHISTKVKMSKNIIELLLNNIDIVISNFWYYYDGVAINKMLFALESGYGEWLFKVLLKLNQYRNEVDFNEIDEYWCDWHWEIKECLMCEYDLENLIGDALYDYDTYWDYVDDSIDILYKKAIAGLNNE